MARFAHTAKTSIAAITIIIDICVVVRYTSHPKNENFVFE